VTLLRASGVRIPVADASADRVFCTTAFDQSDFLGIARQIRRVLKPGGTATFLQARTVSRDQMEKISRAVGSPGRQREFTFVARMLSRLGVQRNLNMWMPRRFTSFVWEARKEA
jgi:ubiquinone/menaquinone biosynthesis C-methylase UbiE